MRNVVGAVSGTLLLLGAVACGGDGTPTPEQVRDCLTDRGADVRVIWPARDNEDAPNPGLQVADGRGRAIVAFYRRVADADAAQERAGASLGVREVTPTVLIFSVGGPPASVTACVQS